jgi:uncharacterized membrane protein
MQTMTGMGKGRLEAFSDGVIAIILTIMVLEIKVPHGTEWQHLWPMLPVFLSYVLSFVYVGIYWSNHHHMLQTVQYVTGQMLLVNLNFLFWLSLLPFATGWMGQNHFAVVPSVLYGAVLLACAISYRLLGKSILRAHGNESALAIAVGKDRKGKLSLILYALAIPLNLTWPKLAQGIYVLVALMWFVPDHRIERTLSWLNNSTPETKVEP